MNGRNRKKKQKPGGMAHGIKRPLTGGGVKVTRNFMWMAKSFLPLLEPAVKTILAMPGLPNPHSHYLTVPLQLNPTRR